MGWAGSTLSAEARGLIEAKKWGGVEDVLKSYSALESLVGGNTVRLPKDNNDVAGLDAVFTKLGMPAAPEGYGLKPAEGGDAQLSADMAKVLHKGRLTVAQAAAVTQGYNELVDARAKAEAANVQEKARLDEVALRKEWDRDYDQNITVARGSAKALGVEKELVDALQNSWGYSKTMKFFRDLGARMGEDKLIFAPGNGSGLTPEAARLQIKQLHKDKAWVEAYSKGGVEQNQQLQRLIAVAESETVEHE